ncbi:MAG: hypothetical protein CMM99_00475 [Rickettsiales bacterium]|nr:hypothetical protein [Rickettsiales bacterium]|tara:strand:- start:533 stop:1087 length:555 start_codon:yes stop_codon:yes gene_type:complete
MVINLLFSMMKKLIFNFLLIVQVIGFGQNDTLRNYHANGQLESIGVLIDNKKEGLWMYYNYDGFLRQSINYKNDKFNGLWKNYIINKKNKLVRNENVYVNGRREGLWKYYVDNKLIKEGYIKNKMRQKIWKYYYDNGQLKKETKWKDDKEIYSRYWNENGNEINKEIYYSYWDVNGNKIENSKL